MTRDQFIQLPAHEIAAILEPQGGRVCTLPVNGTRRWFMLEHTPPPPGVDLMSHYMQVAACAHIRLFEMIFDHGVSTLLSPTFGPDIMQRDEAYTQMALQGMGRLVEGEEFLAFYEQHEVRVRFYGEHRKYFAGTPFEPMSDLFDRLTQQTCHHSKNRLFWGVCAHDAVQPIADLSVEFYKTHCRPPTREELVIAYYGEAVAPVDFFIGFDQFAAYDMPLLTTGEEDLYFTIAPSLYITQEQFREILFDHLYERPQPETDYSHVNDEDWKRMKAFYRANAGRTQGIGRRYINGDCWYPVPQVQLPHEFEDIP